MKTLLFGKAVKTLDLARDSNYRVLDFGCGKGEFLHELSRNVGRKSRLVGYDSMESSIAIAQVRYPEAEFICERFAEELPFSDGSFDVFVTIDTLECIKNKEALLSEIHRILRPGGQVLAVHWNRVLARKAVQSFSDWKQLWMDEADGQMGRKLWGLFEGGGKFRGTPDAFCLIETEYQAGHYGYDRAQDLSGLVENGAFDMSEYEWFRRELCESSQRGDFYSVTSFIYHGRRA